MNIADQIRSAENDLAPLLPKANFNAVVNVMTNHMRHQWARAGYLGLHKKDPTGPAAFIPPTLLLHRLKRRKK